MSYFIIIGVELALLCLLSMLPKRAKVPAMAGAVFFVALLIFRCVLHFFPVLEARMFPWVDYVKYRDFWLYVIGAGFFGLAISRLDVRWNRVVVFCTGLAILGYGAYANRWVVAPEVRGEEVYADEDHHCPQSTMYTCSPASCVTLLSYCGVRVSEREMAARCLTHGKGTYLFNTYRGLRLSLPPDEYKVSIENMTADEICAEGSLCITTWRDMHHSICCVGQGEDVLVHNSLKTAPSVWSKQLLEERYDGLAVVVEKRGRDS